MFRQIKLICTFNVFNFLGTFRFIVLTVGSCSGQDTCACAATAFICKQFRRVLAPGSSKHPECSQRADLGSYPRRGLASSPQENL